MAEKPNRSLAEQTEDSVDLMGAYRFLNNPKTTPERIQYTRHHADGPRWRTPRRRSWVENLCIRLRAKARAV